jgi:hypothetical protein
VLPPQQVETPALPPVSGVPPETLAELSRLKKEYASQIKPETVAAEWSAYLDARGVKSARDLSETDAKAMCEHFGKLCDPFSYPSGSMTPASGPTVSPD